MNSPAIRRMFAAADIRKLKHPNGADMRVKPLHDPVWVNKDPAVTGVTADMLLPDDFDPYAIDETCASVCTSLDPLEAAKRLNVYSPSKTMSPWVLSVAPTFFGTKHANGCDCPDLPGRRHFLFVC